MRKYYESPLFDEQEFEIADVISVTSGNIEGDGYDGNTPAEGLFWGDED